MASRPYRHADGRYAPPPHPMYTDDRDYLEALFPGSMAAWDAAPRPAPRYHMRIDWPHLAVEDARCWHDRHVPETCDCHTWEGRERGWVPWIPREAACDRCNRPGSAGTCPYAEEILGEQRLCQCCDHCRRDCADDI